MDVLEKGARSSLLGNLAKVKACVLDFLFIFAVSTTEKAIPKILAELEWQAA